MTDRVPNTDDFTLLDIIAMSGFTTAPDLVACFTIAAGLPEINYDPSYSGNKTTLMNFRNYHLTLPPPPPTPPTVTTTAVSAVASTTATGGGNVTSSGTSAVTVRGICWSTGATPTIGNTKTTNGSGTGVFTSSMTGLKVSTTYYVRAYATNSVGTSYGNQVSFTTTAAPVGLPVVYTLNVVYITRVSANVNGNVSSDGGSAILKRGICISTGATPTTGNTYVLDPAAGIGFYTGIMTGLVAGTLYHVRAFATNVNGISYGSDVTFTTFPPSPYVYNWYLPSKEEFRAAYLKVIAVGLGTPLKTGSYPAGLYWTSSEDPSPYYDGYWHDTWLQAWSYLNSFGGGLGIRSKGIVGHVRTTADFISTDSYAVKAKVPGGAYVYQVDSLGGGSYHYWIVAPNDADAVAINWSSLNTGPLSPVPTNTAIGTGEANTAAIIAQHGPSGTSAAKIAIGYSLP